jgi:DNA-binding protein H-NS
LKSVKKQKLWLSFKDLAQSMGFSLEELLGETKGKKAKAPIVPRYADPANPNNTWSGRGLKRKWLAAALKSGASIEDFAL